jgi:hypothetical protein
MHRLVTGKSSTAVQTVAVVVFVLIEFSLVIIPFAFLAVRPAGTEAQLQRARSWRVSPHDLQFCARPVQVAVAVSRVA